MRRDMDEKEFIDHEIEELIKGKLARAEEILNPLRDKGITIKLVQMAERERKPKFSIAKLALAGSLALVLLIFIAINIFHPISPPEKVNIPTYLSLITGDPSVEYDLTEVSTLEEAFPSPDSVSMIDLIIGDIPLEGDIN